MLRLKTSCGEIVYTSKSATAIKYQFGDVDTRESKLLAPLPSLELSLFQDEIKFAYPKEVRPKAGTKVYMNKKFLYIGEETQVVLL